MKNTGISDGLQGKPGIALPAGFDADMEETVRDARAAGFETASLVWKYKDRASLARDADAVRREGMTVTSVHGPFTSVPGNRRGINAIWDEGEAGERYTQILIDCVEDAAAAQIPIVVLHPNLGNTLSPASPLGTKRFGRVGECAASLGVRLAVETMEFASHLRAIVNCLPPEVFGICWDAGHSQAYTPEEDYLKEFAHRILAVHLHDNDGKRTTGLPDTRDDSHYLPFDGVRDWESAMIALARAGYRGPLTLEVKRGRDCCDQKEEYARMGQRAFFEEAYRRARRLESMFRGEYSPR